MILPLLFVVLSITTTCVDGAVLSNVIPNQGSLMGGTIITIMGSGFERGGVEGSTTVFIGTDICARIDYYSTDSQIVCYTPPAPEGVNLDAPVKVSLVSVVASEFAINPSGYNPYFYYRDYRTPYVQTMMRGGSAGDLYSFYGGLYASDLAQYDARIGEQVCDLGNPGEINGSPAISGSWGTLNCVLPPQAAGYYNLSLRVSDSSLGYGYPRFDRLAWQVRPDGASTFLTQQYAVVEQVFPTEGGLLGGTYVTIVGRGFVNQVQLPEGTTPRMVTRVRLSGRVPCDVISSSSTQIVCIVASDVDYGSSSFIPALSSEWPTINSVGSEATVITTTNSSSGVLTTTCVHPLRSETIPCSDTPLWTRPVLFPSSRGLRVRRWMNTNGNERFAPITSRPPAFMKLEALATAEGPLNLDAFQQQYDAYFRPVVTGLYTFYIRADDYAEVWLGSSESRDNLTRVAIDTTYTSTYWQAPGQISTRPVFLEAGRRYYLRVWYHEYGGGDNYQLAVRISNISSSYANSWWTEQQPPYSTTTPGARNNSSVAPPPPPLTPAQLTYETPTEMQVISISANVIREVQQVNVSGVASGSFRLRLGSAVSDPLSWDASASSVASAASVLMQQSCNSISGSRTAITGLVGTTNAVIGYSYLLTINCPTPVDYPLLSTVNNNLQPAAGQSISMQSARLIRASTPVSGTFRLGFTPAVDANNASSSSEVTWTGPISFDAANWQLCAAVRLLPLVQSVECDAWGTPGDGRSWRVYFMAPRRDWPTLVIDAGVGVTGSWNLSSSSVTNSSSSSGGGGIRLDGPPSLAVRITTEENGSDVDLFYDPIPADLFEVADELPSVELWVNGMKAACQRDVAGVEPLRVAQNLTRRGDPSECAYLLRRSLTPEVISVEPNITAGATIFAGQNLTLIGTNLGGPMRNPWNSNLTTSTVGALSGNVSFSELQSVSVSIGPAPCVVIEVALDGSRVVCRLDDAPAGDHDVSVLVHSRGGGYARNASPVDRAANTNIKVRVGFAVTSVVPTIGSVMGGQSITVTGTGLARHLGVMIGNANCSIAVAGSPWRQLVCMTPPEVDATTVAATATTITATTAAAANNDTATVDAALTSTAAAETTTAAAATTTTSPSLGLGVSVGRAAVGSFRFAYSEALTSNITMMTPMNISSGITTTVNVFGSFFAYNFSADPAQEFQVNIGGRACIPLNATSEGLTCRLERRPAISSCADQQLASVDVRIRGVGLARYKIPAEKLTVDLALRVTRITPTHGSVAGGTTLTIEGAGFSDVEDSMVVSLAGPVMPPPRITSLSQVVPPSNVFCNVTSSTWDRIICVTQPMDAAWRSYLNTTSISFGSSLKVQVNGIEASCCSTAVPVACNFTFTSGRTPVISSITPTSAVGGSVLTIAGSFFDLGDVTVRVGLPNAAAAALYDAGGAGSPASSLISSCAVVSTSASQITCRLPTLSAGRRRVTVAVAGLGLALEQPVFQHELRVQGFWPTRGSAAGGQIVTVVGAGFGGLHAAAAAAAAGSAAAPSTSMVVGASSIARVLWTSENRTMMTALIPVPISSLSSPATLVQSVSFSALDETDTLDTCGAQVGRQTAFPALADCSSTAGDGNSTCNYVYDASTSITPSITTRSYSGWKGDVITITGTGFGGSYLTSSRIEIGGASCAVTNTSTWTDTSIQCTVGDTPAGTHLVNVYVAGRGLARHTQNTGSLFTSQMEITSIWPTIGSFAGGALVTVRGRGFATNSSSSASSTSEATPDWELGTGFSLARAVSASSSFASAWFCNANCSVVSSTYDTLICRTSSLGLLGSNAAFNLNPAAILTGRITGVTGGQSNWNAAFDGDVETSMVLSASGCSVSLELPVDTTARLTKIMWFPRYRNANRMANGRFESSADGVTWFTLHTIPGNFLDESWNMREFAPDGSDLPEQVRNQARFFRYTGASGSACQVNEIQFIGSTIASTARINSVDTAGNFTAGCSAFASVRTLPSPLAATSAASTRSTTTVGRISLVGAGTNTSVATSDAYFYDTLSTPIITSIFPTNATAMGGTEITLRGRGLGSVAANVTIQLHGFPCRVTAAANTWATCITSPRLEIRPSNPSITVSPVGSAALASSRVQFRYLDLWSSLTTWLNYEPPVEGDTVIVPEGQAVMLDISPPRLFVLAVLGELVFDPRKDITLNASYILVNGGKMSIGTEEEPYMRKAQITLHGDRFKSVEVPFVGAKTFAVYNRRMLQPSCGARQHFHDFDMMTDTNSIRGRLEIHGEPRVRTWTKVQITALAGTNIVVAANDVDFRPGEKIVVTSSSFNFRESEEHIVASLGSDKRTIYLSRPLQYTHVAGVHTVEGRTIDMRYEVGLVSRNIVIQGDDNSARQQFGSHLICIGAKMTLENTEIRNCGQAGVLGRYCSHFHMANREDDSYIRSNSIHNSFQRAVTIHGTHHSRVQNNFAYHIQGHTYFVEDGNERQNVIEGNLVAVTMPLHIMLKSDTKPASFWMSSPENFWRHNVAAGCSHDGYWFELPGNPGGPSFTPTICPVHGHVGEFFNNTAHSNGVHGLRIYPVYLPLADPCDDNSGPAPQYFHNFTAFHNGDCGIFGKENGDLHHIGATLVENGGHDLEWIKLKSVVYDNNPHIVNLLAIASLDGTRRVSKQAVQAPQNEYFYASGITAVNYGDSGALAGCADCDTSTEMRQDGYTYRWEKLKFVNSERRIRWKPPRKQIFWDLDGSLSGTANATLTPFNPWNNVSVCSVQGTQLDGAILCDSRFPIRRLQIDGVNPRELDDRFMRITTTIPAGSSGGNSNDLTALATAMGSMQAPAPNQVQSLPSTGTMNFRVKEIYGWVIPVVANTELALSFVSTIDFQTMAIRWSEPDYLRAMGVTALQQPQGGEWSRMTFGHIDYRHNYEVTYGSSQWRPWLQSRQPTLLDDLGTSAMRNNRVNNGSWSVVMTTRNVTWDSRPLEEDQSSTLSMRIRALQCPREGCPIPPPPLLGNATRWSDPATWAPRPIPSLGEDVTITPTMWVIMDVTPPLLGALTIQGRLEFEDANTDLTLEAQTIVVHGSLQIGTPQKPYQRFATIRLYGDRNSPTAVVDNSVFLGNKVLAVFGRVEMYGLPKAVTWTKLSSTAMPGSTVLSVVDASSWSVGDRVVITPTEYDGPQQVEEAVISAISGRTSITLDRPLVYRHFAGSVRVNGTDIVLAAAVGMLSRNIVFEGANPGPEGYGAHIIVADLPPASTGGASQQRIGSVQLEHVELRNVGKLSSEHAAFTGQFLGGTTLPTSVIINGCGISTAFNYALVFKGARGVNINRNVISKAYRSAIDMDEQSTRNANITNNMVAASLRAPDETVTWVVPLAAFYLAGTPRVLTGNLAAGTADSGFVFRPPPCPSMTGPEPASAAAIRPVIGNNEAMGMLIGVWLMPARPSDAQAAGGGIANCAMISNFTVWKAAHIGIFTLDQSADIRLSRVIVSDSHIGISLNFVSTRPGAWSEVADSFILGSTAASTCNASLTCYAMSAEDTTGTNSPCGSVFGRRFRRVGYVVPQYLNRAKTCEIDGGLAVCRPPTRPERLCSLPWEKRYGLPSTPVATARLVNTAFAFFNETECGGANSQPQRSLAFSINPSQPDYHPSVSFRGVSWTSVSLRARANLGNIDSPLQTSECGSGCDAQTMFFATDADGSFTERSPSTILALSPELAMRSPNCVAAPAETWQAYICPGMRLVPGGVESLDADRGSRRIGPVRFTRLDDGLENENRTASSIGPFDDNCAKRFHFGQFPLAFVPGRKYHVVLAATPPTRMRFWFIAERPDDGVELSVFFTNPNQLQVFVGNDLIPMTDDGTRPSLAGGSPRGANFFSAQERHLTMVMRGGGVATPYVVFATPLIQLTMTLAVSVAEFNAERFVSNLAILLSIPASTIKVVNVRAGSVVADVQIVSPIAADPQNDTATTTMVSGLQTVARQIVTLANSGGLNVGYQVLSMAIAAPVHSASDNISSIIPTSPFVPLPPQTPTPSPGSTPSGSAPSYADTDDDSDGSSWAPWKTAVIVIAGVVALGLVGAAIGFNRYRHNHRHELLESAQAKSAPTPTTFSPDGNASAFGSSPSRSNVPIVATTHQPISVPHLESPTSGTQVQRISVEMARRGDGGAAGGGGTTVTPTKRPPALSAEASAAAAAAAGGGGGAGPHHVGFDGALPPVAITPTVGGTIEHAVGGPYAGTSGRSGGLDIASLPHSTSGVNSIVV